MGVTGRIFGDGDGDGDGNQTETAVDAAEGNRHRLIIPSQALSYRGVLRAEMISKNLSFLFGTCGLKHHGCKTLQDKHSTGHPLIVRCSGLYIPVSSCRSRLQKPQTLAPTKIYAQFTTQVIRAKQKGGIEVDRSWKQALPDPRAPSVARAQQAGCIPRIEVNWDTLLLSR